MQAKSFLKVTISVRQSGCRCLAAVLLLALLLGGMPVAPAYAATTWTVTSGADMGDGICDSDCTLREAMDLAESGDTIVFSKGQRVTLVAPLSSLYKKLSIKGKGALNTIIQAGDCNPVTRPRRCEPAQFRVFTVETGGNLSLEGVTVRYGNCDTSCSGGGGIANYGTMSIKNSTVQFNRAGAGGGIGNDGGRMTLSNTTVIANSANLGAGLYNSGSLTMNNSTISANSANSYAGGLSNIGSVTLKNTNFLGNSADEDGGGIHSSGSIAISSGAFFGNRADNFGGGMFIAGGDVRVSDAAISGNMAVNGGGGVYNTATLRVTDGMFFNNRVNPFGGSGAAIFNDSTGTLTASRSSFFNNIAYVGGGIHNLGSLEVTQSNFTSNTAYNLGGGLSNSSSATVDHCEFYSNTASNYGGGIWNGSTLIATSDVLYGNSAPNGPSIQDDGETYFSNTSMDP